MLEVKDLTKSYKKTLAVDHVSFTIETGRVGILLGPNGAGKSTIIKSISGLLYFLGEVKIDGIPARDLQAKKRFAYIPEIPSMYEALTIREHFEFINRAYNVSEMDYALELAKRFELDDKLDKLGDELSKGMMQKVSIICALMIRPRVALFDEPMVGLDPKAIKELKDLIIELKENGTTILISTHMLEMVKDIWDDMIIINKGKIIGQYRKEDVQDQDIDDIFFEMTGDQ